MSKRHAKQTALMLLCLCIILSLMLSLCFIVTHTEHDCTGSHCHVCAALSAAHNLLGGLCLLSAALIFIAAAIIDVPVLRGSVDAALTVTPYHLKVRLNN